MCPPGPTASSVGKRRPGEGRGRPRADAETLQMHRFPSKLLSWPRVRVLVLPRPEPPGAQFPDSLFGREVTDAGLPSPLGMLWEERVAVAGGLQGWVRLWVLPSPASPVLRTRTSWLPGPPGPHGGGGQVPLGLHMGGTKDVNQLPTCSHGLSFVCLRKDWGHGEQKIM